MHSIPFPGTVVNAPSPVCQQPHRGELRSSQTGTVKWFSDAKGYGFLTAPDGQDVFVHYSVIAGEGFKTLREGQSVEYEAVETPKGWQATWVRAAHGDSQDAPHA